MSKKNSVLSSLQMMKRHIRPARFNLPRDILPDILSELGLPSDSPPPKQLLDIPVTWTYGGGWGAELAPPRNDRCAHCGRFVKWDAPMLVCDRCWRDRCPGKPMRHDELEIGEPCPLCAEKVTGMMVSDGFVSMVMHGAVTMRPATFDEVEDVKRAMSFANGERRN